MHAAAAGRPAGVGDGEGDALLAPGAEHARRSAPAKERAAAAKALRATVPLADHASWEPYPGRDPVALLEEQAEVRIPALVPIRHARMMASTFTYYRGAALPMAADLAHTPTAGIEVQLCGDAHLSNFGFFGSPERHLVFDVNDFDETAPGPFEWDVKRLAASLEIAGRDNGFRRSERRRAVLRAVRTYRETVRTFAGAPMLDVWYARLDVDDLLGRYRSLIDPQRTPSVWAAIVKARAHDSLQAFGKLCRFTDGEPHFVNDPPLVVPIRELLGEDDRQAVTQTFENIVRTYGDTLREDRRHLLDRYRFVDLARKVVGVGSVGTDAWVALLVDRDLGTPLVLQAKEAEASVLERFTRASPYANHGERVVVGQRLMQAASDIFLGWERFQSEGRPRDYYFRQLRDWKGSADIPGMTPAGMELWAGMCGWTLARAHARTGDRIAIAAYLGKSTAFDEALAEFAITYADQKERDHVALNKAVAKGRIAAALGIDE
jgi:uncharacterized protein (DUF2252 family)